MPAKPFPWRAMPSALANILFLLCRQGCELRLPQGGVCWTCRCLPPAGAPENGGLLVSFHMEDVPLTCRLHGVEAAAGELLHGVDMRRLTPPLRDAALEAWCAQLLDALQQFSGAVCRLDALAWQETAPQTACVDGLPFLAMRDDGLRVRGCLYGLPMPLLRGLLALPPRPAPQNLLLLPQRQAFACALPVHAHICRLTIAQCRRAAVQDVLLFPAGEGIAVRVGTVARARLDADHFLHVEECMPGPENTLPDAGTPLDDFPEDAAMDAMPRMTEKTPQPAANADSDTTRGTSAGAEGAISAPSVALESCMLDVQCDLGSISLCLAELADLREGAVLGPLRSTASPVLLRTGGTVIGTGALVDIEGRAGVQIIEWRLTAQERS